MLHKSQKLNMQRPDQLGHSLQLGVMHLIYRC